MADERKWTPVEVIWDAHLREPDPWESEPPPRRSFPTMILPERPARQRQQTPSFDAPDDDWTDEDGPKRKGRGDAGLTKRRRKKRRAWEVEGDE